MEPKPERKIDELVKEAVQYIIRQSYSPGSIYYYSSIWRKLLQYAHEKQEEFYSMKLGLEFYQQFTGLNPAIIPDKGNLRKIRALKVLNDLALGNEVNQKYTFVEPFVPETFKIILKEYEEHLARNGQKKGSVETKVSRIRIFLRHLGGKDTRLEDINFQAITDFHLFLSANYATNAKSGILFTLRDFLTFAERIGAVKAGTAGLITTIHSNKHERLPSTYSVEEINRILAAVDRSTKFGKRDYAMLLFAIQLGIRSSDICHMKLEGMRLVERHITFRQEKTGRMENLPITELTAYAIADYLKYVRPATDSDLLFVQLFGNCKNGYSGATTYRIINKYMKKAGINTDGKRHGMHAMRHSLSSNLLKAGTPLPVISRILGHSSTEITTQYLWMDTEQLRKLSLEVPYEE
jgi:site-specific recombinase XerD